MVANNNIDAFKAKLIKGGARANLFRVICNYPSYVEGADSEITSFMCKGATIPSSVLTPIEVPFRGRKHMIPGDRTFEPLTLTVINDGDFKVRSALEAWMNGINQHKANSGFANPTEYESDVHVEQLDNEGNVVKRYTYIGAWPSNLSQIDLSYDSESTIQEYTCEFSYTRWETAATT